jgi:hypothetical protein
MTILVDRSGNLSDAVHAWRAWTIRAERGTRTPLLAPIGGDRRPWTPRTAMRARCPRHRSHHAPDPRCACGLYAVKDAALLMTARDPAVLGTVDLWGTIVEHERGFRGEFAYPQRLGLICPFCFWNRGAAAAVEVGHVARSRRRRLVPMCDAHLELARCTGYVVDALLDPAAVLEGLLGTYGVEQIDRGLASRLTSPDSDPDAGTDGIPRR